MFGTYTSSFPSYGSVTYTVTQPVFMSPFNTGMITYPPALALAPAATPTIALPPPPASPRTKAKRAKKKKKFKQARKLLAVEYIHSSTRIPDSVCRLILEYTSEVSGESRT